MTGQFATTSLVRHGTGQVTDPVSVFYDLIAPPEATGKPHVMMIHGGCHTGTGYLRTVDGRAGWAYRFADSGYPVIVPDWPGQGRSGALPPEKWTGETIVRGLGSVIESAPGKVVVMTHSMSGAYGWRLLELYGDKIQCLVGVAPGLPGNIQPRPEILRETDQEVEIQGPRLVVRLPKTGTYLPARDFAEKKLIGASTRFPRALFDEYHKSLCAPPARLIYERQNANGTQVRVADTSRLAGKRVLVITGTHDTDHPREIDEPIVGWLNENGAKAEFIYLGDRGIEGNGHMLMMEDNSDEIADIILGWLGGASV